MQRYLLVAAGIAIAAFAIWHPAGRPKGLIASVAPAPARRHRAVRPTRTPSATAVVYVAGAVVHPGLFTLPSGARAEQAIRLAGGLRPNADATGVNLAARVSDGEEIAVPRIGDAPLRRTRTRRLRTPKPVPAVVDVNEADASALAQIPGLGPALGARIAAYRDANGPFVHLDELLDVAGMTPARLDRASPYLALSP